MLKPRPFDNSMTSNVPAENKSALGNYENRFESKI
jgi:hypothetical protein